MRWKSEATAVILILSVAASANAGSLTINFDYSRDTSTFFDAGTTDGATARATLAKAGGDLAGVFCDDLTGITPGGGNVWNAVFSDPSTGVSVLESNLVVAADTLTVFVGARLLNTGVLGRGGPGGFQGLGGGSADFYNSIYARGQGAGDFDSTYGPSAYDFGPWGGSLAIDLDTNWNLDYADDMEFSEYDLYSVAVHELAHIFGVGLAKSWLNQEDGAGEFDGPNAVAEYGSPVPMLANFSHWDYDTMSTVYPDGVAQEAAMDPNIANNQRKFLTDLDVAGLVDMGWTEVPEPSTVIMLCSAAIVVLARTTWRRRKQKP